MHPSTQATLGEYLGKIIDYGKGFGSFSLTLVLDEAGDYHSMLNFGREAEDSPMVAGSSLGYGTNPIDALAEIVQECRI